MLPAERRDVLEQFVGNISTLLAQMGRSSTEIDGVPVNDGTDDQLESGCTECLTVVGAIADFTALMEENGAFELVGRFTLIKTGLTAPAQSRARIPLDHEQGTLDAAEFAQRFGQVAGFRRGGQPLEDRRRRNRARRDRRGQTQEIVPMLQDARRVDGRADVIGQRWISIGLFEGVELPVLDVAQSRREALADQGEQGKDMIAGAAGMRVR